MGQMTIVLLELEDESLLFSRRRYRRASGAHECAAIVDEEVAEDFVDERHGQITALSSSHETTRPIVARN